MQRQIFPEAERRKIVALAKKTLWMPESKDILEYLKYKRKLSDEIIERFSFGYVPCRVYHELSGRIVMPINDAYGELVAITSRDIKDKAYQKHWHESYDKLYYLYGLDISKQEIIKRKKTIIVEGQFDTAYLHSIGIKFAVGSIGTAVSYFHLILLSRYCSDIYLFFDGDDGGKKALKRVLEIGQEKHLSSYGINLIPIDTPRNKDPDDFEKEEIINFCIKAKQNIKKE